MGSQRPSREHRGEVRRRYEHPEARRSGVFAFLEAVCYNRYRTNVCRRRAEERRRSIMELFKTLIVILLSSVLVNNYVLSRFLGICPFLGVSNKLSTATGMSMAVCFVITLATVVTYLLNSLLAQFGLEFLQTISFILVIAALVQMVEIVLKKISPSLYAALGIFLPLITTNCAVLGVALTVVQKSSPFAAAADGMMNLGEATVYAFATSLGFGLAMVLFAGLREQLALNDVPKEFKGIPIALVTAGILAMAFMGFSGLV